MHDIDFGGKGNVGIVGTCFNIFKCFIGIALLAIPSAFSEVRLLFFSKICSDRNYWRIARYYYHWNS